MIRRRLTLLVIFCMSLAGCITYPHPHDVVDLSPVIGKMHLNGDPVSGRVLTMNSLWNHELCADPVAEAVTDADGRFQFNEITSRHFFRTVILAPSSPTYSMTVCSDEGSGSEPIFATLIWATLPRHLELDCDLSVKTTASDYCSVADWAGWNFMHRADQSDYGTSRGDPNRKRGDAKRRRTE